MFQFIFMVFDLLPILMPQVFPPGSDLNFIKWLKSLARFDGVFCISRTVAENLVAWLDREGQERKRSFSIKWVSSWCRCSKFCPVTWNSICCEESVGTISGATQFLDGRYNRTS